MSSHRRRQKQDPLIWIIVALAAVVVIEAAIYGYVTLRDRLLAEESAETASTRIVLQAVEGTRIAESSIATRAAAALETLLAAVTPGAAQTTRASQLAAATSTPSPTASRAPSVTNTPIPPTVTLSPTATQSPTALPVTATITLTRPPATATSAPVRAPAANFGYGIQADMIYDQNYGRIVDHTRQLGFGWIKQQIEWFRYHQGPGQYEWSELDRIVNACSGGGLNILFSVVKAPRWARPAGDTDEGPPADFNVYGEFLTALATRYKGRVQAYEIWNEQNLYYEWGGRGGKISAARYVELLKVAYRAVKAADPAAVVISGALTPTGVSDGDIAIDDRVYLEQMYQAGLKSYCDAVGAHPSGYNNPPDADWRTFQDPSDTFGAKNHPSWFFRGTVESYRNTMVAFGDADKKIWVTEFGWASVDGLGVLPVQGYGYAADNTQAEQAEFIVRAFQMGKGWGFVGAMFLWNLNFGPVSGAQDEKAAFGIVRPDWAPRPAFAALRDMAK
jgi:hypothetical protein